MKLVLGSINGEYLRGIMDDALGSTEQVDAAIAYANTDTLLFD